MEFVKIHFKNSNKLAIITNFLVFFFYFSDFIWNILPPGSGSRRENECGFVRIQIHSPKLNRLKITSSDIIFLYRYLVIKSYRIFCKKIVFLKIIFHFSFIIDNTALDPGGAVKRY